MSGGQVSAPARLDSAQNLRVRYHAAPHLRPSERSLMSSRAALTLTALACVLAPARAQSADLSEPELQGYVARSLRQFVADYEQGLLGPSVARLCRAGSL